MLFFLLILAAAYCDPSPLGPRPELPAEGTPIEVLQEYPLPNPEEICVDPTGSFFLTGTNDGYLYKVDLETGETNTVLGPKDFNGEYFQYWTDEEVRDYCNGDDLAKEVYCGRILGVRFHHINQNKVYIVNSYFGIYEYRLHGRRHHRQLTQLVAQTGQFLNDVLSVGPYVFWTNSHTSLQRNQVPYCVLDPTAPQGTFNVYNYFTGETTVLADDFFFTNGMALSSDGRYLYISETDAARVRKFDIWTMEMDGFLIENLPILTDNIYLDKSEHCFLWWCRNDGTLLVPGYARSDGLDEVLTDMDALDALLAQGPAVWIAQFGQWLGSEGIIVKVSEATGEIEDIIYDKGGENITFTASAHLLDEDEYIVGSVFAPKAVRFRVL